MNRDIGIYLVADSASTAGRPLTEIVAAAVAGGAQTIQLRCKDMAAGSFLDEVLTAARAASGRARILVNDRVDVFLAARAAGAQVHGVHIGQSDLPPALVRAMIGPDSVLGLSASTPEELDAAHALPAGTIDYLGIGAVRATPTKPDHPQPLGFDGLAAATARCTLPTVAIGGIGTGDATQLIAAGTNGMAVVRAICAADDPRGAIAELIAEWEAGIRA
ncbi:thiamine phosphate synthase [Paeniglutamicibacter cryotolerans]|uniref:Thiamine-phosphate synthase n=1 Tax=Paeniglutamicibacter cryotolerans TaxID=670079 RepID=A0A839QHA2_9MICC|nr:thiamine phosphate synthase [Paeniglutamicibacter cryotolerans]MBB2994983.1 thiamine-phosphate diphosphorylase [Paeniglutamicibacter cryotolerans]